MEYCINLILLFFTYSVIGWCIEVTLKYIQFHRFINRGFLTGPVLPIYGFGAVLITLAIEKLSPFEFGYGTTYVISFVICGTIEYLTSYVMEKRFHARWWDYSQKPMNLNGRIWIGNLVLFGLGGVAIIHILNPLINLALSAFSLALKEICVFILLTVFVTDSIFTHFILKLVKIGVESSEADSTEEISTEIYRLLSDRSFLYRRFADAYPDVIYRTERINARLSEVKAETEQLRREAEHIIKERRDAVADRLEPSSLIRNRIISWQDSLISMLYDDRTASDEMKQLKAEIDQEKQRLDNRPLNRIIGSRKGE